MHVFCSMLKRGKKCFNGGRICALSLFNRLEHSPGWKLPGICEGESRHVILSSFTTWWHAARRASRSLIVIGESPDSSSPQERGGKAGQPARTSLLQNPQMLLTSYAGTIQTLDTASTHDIHDKSPRKRI